MEPTSEHTAEPTLEESTTPGSTPLEQPCMWNLHRHGGHHGRTLLRHLDVMSRDVVLAPARNDTVPIQEVSVQTACH